MKNNKYFIQKEIERARQHSADEKMKIEQRKKRELENVEFVVNQIEEKRNKSRSSRIGRRYEC